MSLPSNLRVPFVYAEFNPRARGATPLAYNALIVGQKTSGGTATALTRYQVNSPDHAGKLFGYGSIMHRQFLAWFAVNKLTRVYGIALADDAEGTARTQTWTLSGETIGVGTLVLSIAGKRYAVGADGVSDTPTTLATKLKDAVNRDPACEFIATNTAGAFTLTARHKGALQNGVDIRWNPSDGDAYPPGLSNSAGSPTAGATDPDDSAIIAVLGEDWYNIIVNPYTANLAAWDAELEDRFGALRQIDGRLYTSERKNYADTVTAGLAINSKHIRYVHCIGALSSPYELAASLAGIAAREGERLPVAPLTDLEMVGMVPPPAEDRLLLSENNSLLYSGVAVWAADASGKMRVVRSISTYRTNDAGAPDTSYLDDPTMATVSAMRYDLRNQLLTEFRRAVVVDDGTPTPSQGEFVTPSMIKAKCVTIFLGWQSRGWVENAQQFIDDLVVERDQSDPTRVNLSLSPDTANPLMVLGVDIRFLL